MNHVTLSGLFLFAIGCQGGEVKDDNEGGGTDSSDSTDALASGLVVNEFQASNAATVSDESGAFPDWVELYNGSDTDIDLSDYSITDDLEEPQKHILGDVTVEAWGFVVLFADNDVEDGAHHLGFQLNKDGEFIGLYDPDGYVLTELEFQTQVTDMSSARFPDGSEDWEVTDAPTPGETNGES